MLVGQGVGEGVGEPVGAAVGASVGSSAPLSYVGSNSTIELSNFEGLVLGCIEAKFCK